MEFLLEAVNVFTDWVLQMEFKVEISVRAEPKEPSGEGL